MLDQNMNSIISFLVGLINGLLKLMGIDFEQEFAPLFEQN